LRGRFRVQEIRTGIVVRPGFGQLIRRPSWGRYRLFVAHDDINSRKDRKSSDFENQVIN
jgi:hypothetical protein